MPVVVAAVVVGVDDPARVLLNGVGPQALGVVPHPAALPGGDQANGNQRHEDRGNRESQRGRRGGASVQPPRQCEQQADVCKVRVTIRHDRLPHRDELQHQHDVDEEERETEQHGRDSTASHEARRQRHHDERQRGIELPADALALHVRIGIDRRQMNRDE